MPPGAGIHSGAIWIELAYAIIILLTCFIIYVRTKELYDLTSHKGIKYFRNAFLFFGLAYFLRFFVRFFVIGFHIPRGASLSVAILLPLIAVIFVYATTMAVFYLVYSATWKKLDEKIIKEKWLHLTAILISLASLFFAAPFLPVIIQTALLLYAVMELYTNKETKKQKKHHSDFRIIYLLLLVFSVLNIADIAIPNFFRTVQIIIYILSAAIFLLILGKVIQKTRVKNE